MTFLSPALLWSLLALLPLAAIYFLKVRPRRKPTTAYFLWEKIFQEKRAQSLFNRLRDAWSLILMLLAATAVCLALGRPEWADTRKDLLIVIDNSASMDAREGIASRLDRAKRAAREIVEGLNGNQRAAVATLAQNLNYRSHLTDNPRELMEAIDAVEAVPEPLDLSELPSKALDKDAPKSESTKADAPKDNIREGEAPAEPSPKDEKVNEATARQEPRLPSDDKSIATEETEQVAPVIDTHRILLVSDGAFDATKLPAHVELLKVGEPVENLGLVAADMSFLGGGTSRLGLYYQVVSTFKEPQKVDLTLSSLDDNGVEQLQKVIPLTVNPGTNSPETFELAEAPAGRWIARLDLEDALMEDNAAYLAVAKPQAIRVQVESEDRFFLENSVHAFSRGEGLLTLVPERPEVVLAKSASPKSDLAVIFQPSGESPWWTSLGEEVEAGPARVLVENHPALRHLDATSIPFVGARRIEPVAGAEILVADDSGLPLIYKARQANQTAIVVNMDPVAAEFYFSAWFPVLVHSAVTHLVGRENSLAAAYRPGESVPIPGGREDLVTKVAGPILPGADPTKKPATDEIKGQWFRGIDKLGFYSLENPTGKQYVGGSLCSSDESLLNNDTSASNHEALSRGRSPAQWLTILAIIVLSAESILYHRRKVG